ncbi:MAG: VCBS repeat-containing protein, partial [Candidatus Zixiibacteriota bacterium]
PSCVGCVATATAQVMNFWEWPPSGGGWHSYDWNGDNTCGDTNPIYITPGGILTADYNNPYDWQNMPSGVGMITEEEAAAVAELCYEVGVAFSTNYGSDGSTATTAECITVLPLNFRYKNTIIEEQRQAHTAESWFAVVRQEIDSGRPLIYRFYEDGFGGHAMVCDGWRVSGDLNQLHINYGWGGSHNTWFTVDELYPLTSDYVTTQRAYRGIEPEPFPVHSVPKVIATHPAPNQLNVPAGTDITATFDADMDPSTINSSSIVVNGQISGLHRGVVSYDPSRRQVAFDAYRDFLPGERVAVTVSDEVRTLEDTPLFGGRVYTFRVAVAASQGTFEQASLYSTIGVPASVCAADLNGDAFVDLATACTDSAKLTILLNDGTGTFVKGPECCNGELPNDITAADFDMDGDMDLATTNPAAHGVSVLLNNGDGSFAWPSFYSVSNFTYPASIVTADFNGDGWPDLATGNGGDCGLSVFRNAGDGSFWQRSDHDRRGGREPFGSICAGDFDGNGYLDLAKAGSIAGTPDIHFQGGDGYFQTPLLLAWHDAPQFVSAGDLNGDGNLDILTSDSARLHQFSIALNNGDMTFSIPEIYAAGGKPWSTTAADVDGDGDLDLLTTHYQLGVISVLSNSGDGTFTLQAQYSADSWPSVLITADVDNDGDQDLVAASRLTNSISVLKNGTSTAAVTVDTGAPPLPNEFALLQNYPNPFNAATEIAFVLPGAVRVRLDVFNVMGQRVTTLIDERRPAGHHSVIWNAESSASGMYFLKIEAGDFSESRKMLLVK